MRLPKKYMFKGLCLLFITYCYIFSNGLLTKFLYPLENKYHLYWVIGGKTYNIIDCNIPHVIAFIGLGMLFKWWGLVFMPLLEAVQWIVKGKFALIDIVLNLVGLFIGIFTRWCYGKIKKFCFVLLCCFVLCCFVPFGVLALHVSL